MPKIARYCATVNLLAGLISIGAGLETLCYGANRDAWLMVAAGCALIFAAHTIVRIERRKLP